MKVKWIVGMLCLSVLLALLGAQVSYAGYGGGKPPVPAPKPKFTPMSRQELDGLPHSTGEYLSSRRLNPIVNKASDIVLGKVQSAQDTAYGILNEVGVPVVLRSVVVRVESTLKGSGVRSGTTIPIGIYIPYGPHPAPEIAVGYRAVFFIASDGTGADLYCPTLPLGPLAIARPAGVNALDTIKRLVVLSLTINASQGLVDSCAKAVVDLGITEAGDSLSQIVSSSDVNSTVTALWALMRLEDARAFPLANDYILGVKRLPTYLRRSLTSAVASLRDPSLAEFIIPLASAKDPWVRSAGLQGLRNMRSARCLSILVAALDDQDAECQYQGMMGMVDFFWDTHGGTTQPIVGGGKAPQYSDYLEKPAYYLALWRDWWNNEGKAKYATVPVTDHIFKRYTDHANHEPE